MLRLSISLTIPLSYSYLINPSEPLTKIRLWVIERPLMAIDVLSEAQSSPNSAWTVRRLSSMNGLWLALSVSACHSPSSRKDIVDNDAASLASPTSSIVAPNVASNSGAASAAPSNSFPPILTRLEVGKPPTDVFDCPSGKFDSLRKLSLKALAKLADRNERPCAQVILGERLLERAKSASDFREATHRLLAGHDANEVTGNCDVFELGIGSPVDLRRAAQCYHRLGRWLELSVYVAGGSGVQRDPELAQAIFDFASRGTDDCTVQKVEDLIRNVPPSQGYRWCEDAACTTLDTNVCEVSRNLKNRWLDAERRESLAAQFDEPTRRRLDTLLQVLSTYADADGRCVYQQYIGGTMRNSLALTRQDEIHQSFERVLALIVAKRLPAAAPSELTNAEHDLQAAEQRQFETSLAQPAEIPALRTRCHNAHLAFERYTHTWLTFSRQSGLQSASADGDLRLLLLRERINMLRDAGP